MQQDLTAKVSAAAQEQAHHSDAEQAVAHDAVEVVVPAGTHVLAGKGHGRLRKGIHAGVDEALEVGCGRVSGHDRGTKGIDGRLDHHVGQAEHGALQTGGQADPDDLQHGFLVDAQMPQVKVHGTLFLDQQHRDHNGGYRLAEDGGQRHARHTHLEHDDEQQVQHHIDDTCHRQTDQRAAGVAHGTQQGGVEVVQHGHRHSDEVDLQVKGGKVNDILGAGHQFQQAVGCKKAHKSHQNATHKAQGNSSLHRFVHALVILCTITAGRHNVCTQRKADKQVDQQVDERTVGTNCCQRGAADEPAHHDHIGSIEQQLQKAGCRQRQGKQDDLFQHRAAGQITGLGHLCHESSASFETSLILLHQN